MDKHHQVDMQIENKELYLECRSTNPRWCGDYSRTERIFELQNKEDLQVNMRRSLSNGGVNLRRSFINGGVNIRRSSSF